MQDATDAAVEAERFNQRDYVECRASGEKFCSRMTTLPPASGMLAGMLWPLYWSWEAWS